MAKSKPSPAPRQTARKRSAGKGARSAARPPAAPRAARKKSQPGKATRPKRLSLGRPLVTGEEKLYLLFKEDYHARQIFEFLRVETVKELEQYSPQQIVKLLSQPIQTTVRRIRRKLAAKNRHLRDDLDFALGCRVEEEGGEKKAEA